MVGDVIASNKGLIFKQLNKFGLYNDHEAESIGYEALFMAANTFDESKGYKFSTYATVCIYNALGSYLRTLNKQRQLDVISYHATHGEDDDLELLGLLSGVGDVEEAFLRQEQQQMVRKVYDEAYARVTNVKHLRILDVWQDSYYEATTSEIARRVGVSQSYVSQVLNNFKYSMRKRLEVYYDRRR